MPLVRQQQGDQEILAFRHAQRGRRRESHQVELLHMFALELHLVLEVKGRRLPAATGFADGAAS